jgi:hypothetical protein
VDKRGKHAAVSDIDTIWSLGVRRGLGRAKGPAPHPSSLTISPVSLLNQYELKLLLGIVA